MKHDRHTYRDLLARFLRWKFARYVIVALLFGIWMLLLDPDGYFPRRRLRAEIRSLERQKTYYLDKANDDRRKINELRGDRKSLEKFAREQFLMKMPDEEIFIVTDD